MPDLQISPCPVCGKNPQDNPNFRPYGYAEGWRVYCTNIGCPSRPTVCSRNRDPSLGQDGSYEEVVRRWNALTKEEANSPRYAHFVAF